MIPFINSTRCHWYEEKSHQLSFVAYKMLMPMYFVLGTFGHSILLIAFRKQSKSESSFGYQVYVEVSSILEVVVVTTSELTYFLLSGAWTFDGVPWFTSCYVCMWYTAHLSFPLGNTLVTLSMLLTIAISAERVFALGKPISYAGINHKRHQLVALCTCIFISVITSLFDIPRLYPTLDTDGLHYTFGVNVEFTSTFAANFLTNLRNAVRIAGLILLIFLNVIMIILYKISAKKTIQLTSGNAQVAKKKREQEKVLIICSFFQSFFLTIPTAMLSAYYTGVYVNDEFYFCEGTFVGDLYDTLLYICDTADFFVVFCVCKSLRTMIFESVPGMKRFLSTTTPVVPLQA